MYKYAYLFSDLIFVAAWLIIFFWRKDTRKELLWVSAIFGASAYLMQPLFLIDWWHPETITGTKFGIEDFMFCFFGGGGLSVLYQILFKKKTVPLNSLDDTNRFFGFFTIILFLFLNYFTFFVLSLHSFYSSVIAFGVAIFFIWLRRKDLILPSLLIGFISVPLAVLWFWWAEWLSPGWVQNVWYLDKLSGLIILKAPIEDLIWAFFAAAYISVIYKFWRGEKLQGVS
ncbi:MAG: lycopene cyclase domain-containing protein [Patescibacteria group bacterium]